MPKVKVGSHRSYELQAEAVKDQANPVSGDVYVVLTTKKLARIYTFAVKVVWTVQPNPLEVHALIDGQTYRWSFANPVTNTYYIIRGINAGASITDQGLSITESDKAFVMEGKSITFSVETTGGTVSQMVGRTKFGVKT